MHNRTQSNVWQTLSAALLGVLSALLITWISFGKEVVTRSEVESIMNNSSPYIKAESGINERLRGLEKGVDEINRKLDKLLEAK